MRKNLVGGAFVVAATLFAVQPSETITTENNPVHDTTKEATKEIVVNREPEQIPSH